MLYVYNKNKVYVLYATPQSYSVKNQIVNIRYKDDCVTIDLYGLNITRLHHGNFVQHVAYDKRHGVAHIFGY